MAIGSITNVPYPNAKNGVDDVHQLIFPDLRVIVLDFALDVIQRLRAGQAVQVDAPTNARHGVLFVRGRTGHGCVLVQTAGIRRVAAGHADVLAVVRDPHIVECPRDGLEVGKHGVVRV